MQARDKLRTVEYFEDCVLRKRELIETDKQRLIDPIFKNKRLINSSLAGGYAFTFFAMYSAGSPIGEIRPLFSKMLAYTSEAINDVTGPGIPLDLLSLGTLLGFTPDDLQAMQDILDKTQRKDPYVLFLAEANGLSDTMVKPDKSSGSWWSYFLKLQEVDGKEERERYLGDYLRRHWYNAQRSEAWWGSHKREGWGYTGYWAYDIAACAKAMGLDDSSFCDHKYYPKDLAHYL
jgi:hypothetical protein